MAESLRARSLAGLGWAFGQQANLLPDIQGPRYG